MLKIAVVIVTYNRLALLQEAVAAVQCQTYPINYLLVIDNSSTDNTAGWLHAQRGVTSVTQPNTGGSGGFYTGIRLAALEQPDWVWVMDDDTIPRPDTLEKLVEKLRFFQDPVGFVSSKSIWMDGSPHLMNLPAIQPSFNKIIPFNKYDEYGVLLTETSSFVSLLLNTEAINQVGLPFREFFIWGDDQEYTRRITRAGYLGLYCMDSIVLHKTGINYFPDFYHDTVPNLWKHHYGFRNEFFMVKKNRGVLYFILWLPLKVGYTSLKLLRIRTEHRFKFIRVLWSSAWRSVFFNPKIKQVS